MALSVFLWGMLAGTTLGSFAKADEFRIVSEIFSGDSKTPISRNLTLFSERLICDFLMSDDIHPQPKEVTLYDGHQKKFVLLDMQRKVRTEISDLQIEKLIDTLARETQSNDGSKFLISDNFTDDTDWAEGSMRLTSPNLTYFFRGSQPKDSSILPPYFEFLDNFTKLNATDPRKIPPFPRMKLNQRIKQIGWVPSEVRVTAISNDFFREAFEATSKHTLTMGLTSRDKELIANAKRDWLGFRLVELTEYRQVGSNREKREGVAKAGENFGELNRR